MPISRELFLSILAMDAYNRGYNSGVVRDPKKPLEGVGGNRIGNATIARESSSAENSSERTASFFAISYTIDQGRSYASATTGGTALTAGTKIIAFRGTDNIAADSPAFAMGLGAYGVAQGDLALDFYRQANGGAAAQNSQIVTTRHSLGGGLAGTIGALDGAIPGQDDPDFPAARPANGNHDVDRWSAA